MKKSKQKDEKRTDRMTGAYHEGRRAFIDGDPTDNNPYHSTHEEDLASRYRVDWFNGWYDEWRWSRWGKNEDEEIVC